MDFNCNIFYLQDIEDLIYHLNKNGYFCNIMYKILLKVLNDLNIDTSKYPKNKLTTNKHEILPDIQKYRDYIKNNLIDVNLSLEEATKKYGQYLNDYLLYKYSLLLNDDNDDDLILRDNLDFTVLSPGIDKDSKIPYYYWEVYTLNDQIQMYIDHFSEQVDASILKQIVRFIPKEFIFTNMTQD